MTLMSTTLSTEEEHIKVAWNEVDSYKDEYHDSDGDYIENDSYKKVINSNAEGQETNEDSNNNGDTKVANNTDLADNNSSEGTDGFGHRNTSAESQQNLGDIRRDNGIYITDLDCGEEIPEVQAGKDKAHRHLDGCTSVRNEEAIRSGIKVAGANQHAAQHFQHANKTQALEYMKAHTHQEVPTTTMPLKMESKSSSKDEILVKQAPANR